MIKFFKIVGAALVLVIAFLVLLIGYAFNPWKNDEHAMRKQSEKLCDGFATYYTQEMWDGTIQLVVYSNKVGPEGVKAPNGEFPSSVGKVLVTDFRHSNQEYGEGLVFIGKELNFCSPNGCKNITNCSTIATPVASLDSQSGASFVHLLRKFSHKRSATLAAG